jgi:hypothetical protein
VNIEKERQRERIEWCLNYLISDADNMDNMVNKLSSTKHRSSPLLSALSLTDQMEDLYYQFREFTVFYELAQVQEGSLPGVGDGCHQLYDTVYDALLELYTALLAEESCEEVYLWEGGGGEG